MKTIYLILTAFVAPYFCHAQAKMEVTEMLFDFDTVVQGDPVTHDFLVVNTGNEPLIINKVNTSCGCDVPTWHKEPVMSGDTTKVNYKYDSNRLGMINKSMTIYTNDTENPTVVVRVKGIIIPKEK